MESVTKWPSPPSFCSFLSLLSPFPFWSWDRLDLEQRFWVQVAQDHKVGEVASLTSEHVIRIIFSGIILMTCSHVYQVYL